MNRLTRFVASVAVVAAIAAPAAVRADDQDTIAYREDIMKTLGDQAASIGMIIQGKAPAENIVAHTQILALAAASALDAFEPKVAGGESKPEVWAQWADFSKKMNEFSMAAADLAKTAKAGGLEAVKPKMQATMTCKGCHDVYRQKK